MPVVFYSNEEPWLHTYPDVLDALDLRRENRAARRQYVGQAGDFWVDSDMVRAEGITLRFNYLHSARLAILNFDPSEYPEAEALVRAFCEEMQAGRVLSFDYDFHNNTWPRFYGAERAIAYRGGQGYSYGIYVRRETDAHQCGGEARG
jgi:hypothetical protein